jgi:hypothetical protein
MCPCWNADLRSFWSNSRGSNPSANVGATVDVKNEEQKEDEFYNAVAAVEEELENAAATKQIQEEFEHVVVVEQVGDEFENVMSALMEEAEQDAETERIRTQFNPDHIITNPRLRIPIDQFSINIRDEVRRAFIVKGPTQLIGYSFP